VALFLPRNPHLDKRRFNGNTTPGKKENTVKEGFFLQHVHRPGLSGSSDYGIDRRYEGCASHSRVAGRGSRCSPAEGLAISDSEEPPGQGTDETLNTLQVLLLRLIKREEMVFRRQTVSFEVLRETLIEARAGREVYFEDIVERPLEKGKTARP
jgi:hypothetical protein